MPNGFRGNKLPDSSMATDFTTMLRITTVLYMQATLVLHAMLMPEGPTLEYGIR